jgi:hypothetical protein
LMSKKNEEHALYFLWVSVDFWIIALSQGHNCKSSSSPVITLDKKIASSEVIWQSSSQTLTRCFFWSAVRNHIMIYMNQVKGCTKSAHRPSCAKFCTLTPKICWYYHLLLHLATTIAVQMAALVPCVYSVTCDNFCLKS